MRGRRFENAFQGAAGCRHGQNGPLLRNPQLDTQKHGKINSLYGYLFGGDVSRLLLLNLGPEAKTVATDGLGFAAASFEQISAGSPETPVTGPSSLARHSRKVDASKQVVLRPYSITVIQ